MVGREIADLTGVEGGVEFGDPNWDTRDGAEPAERAETLATGNDILDFLNLSCTSKQESAQIVPPCNTSQPRKPLAHNTLRVLTSPTSKDSFKRYLKTLS